MRGPNYQDNWGGQTNDVRYKGGIIDPPSDLDRGAYQTTGQIARWGDIL